jgi:plasmid stabilization system protein ParE
VGEKKQLDWSRRAERDADSIYDYIALDNQAAARQVMGELRKAINSLIEFSLLGHAGQITGTR